MSIELDPGTFRRLTDAVMPGERLAPSEARTIAQLAQLAAGIDLEDDAAERGLLGELTHHLCALAGIPSSSVPVLSPLPIDAEERRARIASLASQLAAPRARELAFVAAYLLIASDLELAPVESELLDGLRRAFELDAARADELLAEASALVTPGARDQPPDAAAPPE